MFRLEAFKILFKSSCGRMKTFAIRFEWKKAFIFLFFIFLSFIFWVLQSMNYEYETQISVPIVYKLSPDMAFIDAPPAAITARIRDRGGELLNYSFKKIYINIDSEKTADRSGGYSLETAAVEALLMKQLRPSTNLLSFSPQSMLISYSRKVGKTLPVAFNGNISTVPGYIVSGNIEFTPSEVEVYGGDLLMDTLNAMQTEYTELENVGRTVIKKLKIRSERGAVVKPEVVTAMIPVEEYAEKQLEIKIQSADVPDGYLMRMFPSSVKLSCNVPVSLFKELSDGDFVVEASYSDLDVSHPGILPLRVTVKPAWIYHTALSQESIEFIIEQDRQ